MRKRLSERISPLMGWHVVSVVWLALAVQLGGMSAFRAVTHSGMAQTFDFGDVPFLRFCNRSYAVVYWLALGLGAGLVVALGAACHWLCEGGLLAALRSLRRAPRQARLALGLLVTVALFVVLGLVASRYSLVEDALAPDLEPTGPIDWLLVALAPAGACLLVALTVSHSRQGRPSDVPLRPEPVSVPTRLGTVYLLGVGAVIVYALLDHLEFWSPAANGGYDYTPYFLGDEIASANLVLYSTSLLFASIAAVAGCVGYLVFRRLSRRGRESGVAMGVSDCWRQAFLLALFWSFALGAPWQLKLLPEIRAENGWIMPAMVLSVLAAALAPAPAIIGRIIARPLRVKPLGNWPIPTLLRGVEERK